MFKSLQILLGFKTVNSTSSSEKNNPTWSVTSKNCH